MKINHCLCYEPQAMEDRDLQPGVKRQYFELKLAVKGPANVVGRISCDVFLFDLTSTNVVLWRVVGLRLRRKDMIPYVVLHTGITYGGIEVVSRGFDTLQSKAHHKF